MSLEEKAAWFIIEVMMGKMESASGWRVKRLMSWTILVMTLLLTGLSIYGAFIGAEKAQAVFNSVPMSVYWVGFTILLPGGIMVFTRLMHVPGLLLIHVGCVLVLVGGILGSQAGIKIQNAMLDVDTIRTGQMLIHEGMASSAVEMEDEAVKTLPFEVRLVDFRMAYYEPGSLLIQTPQGQEFTMPASPGSNCVLKPDQGSVEIVRRFERFKLTLQNGKRIAIDDPGGDSNPALELKIKKPDGVQAIRYVFEFFPEFSSPDDTLRFLYRRTVQDFISDLEVIEDGKVMARKSIEVNRPLHYGGYYFYQNSYDDTAGRFTVLRVTSDRGLWIVYLGYVLLCAGVFWHLWLRHLFGRRATKE